MTALNVGMVTETVVSVKVDGQTVTDKSIIAEFIENAEKGFFQTILDHLEKQRDAFALTEMEITTTEQERKEGAAESFKLPIQFDTANFFA